MTDTMLTMAATDKVKTNSSNETGKSFPDPARTTLTEKASLYRKTSLSGKIEARVENARRKYRQDPEDKMDTFLQSYYDNLTNAAKQKELLEEERRNEVKHTVVVIIF